MKKRKKTAQLNTLMKTMTDEDGEITEEVLDKQEVIEDEVGRFQEGLYAYRAVQHTKEEILEVIGKDVKTISEHEKEALENPISMDEVNICLKATRNNVSSGVSGFSGGFLKNVLVSIE